MMSLEINIKFIVSGGGAFWTREGTPPGDLGKREKGKIKREVVAYIAKKNSLAYV